MGEGSEELGAPGGQGAPEPGDLRHRTGARGGDDLLGGGAVPVAVAGAGMS